MALIDRKVNDWSQAVSSLDDKPKMTAAALKAAFDSNSNQLKPAINGIIDDLTSVNGASNIGLTPIDGLSGSNVQAVLQAISLLIKSNDVDLASLERLFTADGAALVGLQPVSGVSASNLQQAIISLADTINKIDPYLGNPVAISQGGTDSRTSQEAIYKLGSDTRENLADNPDFKINQRGKTTAISGEFISDRWQIAANTEFTVQNNNGDIIMNNTGSGNLFLIQKHELSYLEENEVYTLSVLTNKGLFFSNLKVGEASYPATGLYLSLNKTLNLELTIGVLTQSSFTIYFCKCEKGKNQTLGYKVTDGQGYKGTGWQLFETPNKVTELAKCHRYYWESDMVYSSQDFFNEDILLCNVKYPVRMRIIPSVIIKSINGTNGILSEWQFGQDTKSTVTLNNTYATSEGFVSLQITNYENIRYAFRVVANAEL